MSHDRQLTVKGSSASSIGTDCEGAPFGGSESLGLTPPAFLRPSNCASKRERCSTGSVNSEKALASSLPATTMALLRKLLCTCVLVFLKELKVRQTGRGTLS